MIIRVATLSDLSQVVRLRMCLFSESSNGMSPSENEATEQANRMFFQQNLDSPLSRTWVAEIERNIVAIGTLAYFVRPPHPRNLSGKEAYLLNMYTLPEYRKRGLASEIVSEAMSYAQREGLKRIWLHASDAGRPVYEAAGFRTSTAYMEVTLP